MDIANLMQMATQVREQLANSQEAAARLRVTGEAGGGMARVVLTGKYEAVEVSLDPKLMESSDKALIEDLVRAAFNQAANKVAEELRQKMGNFAQGLGVDLSAFGFPDANR
ncbi:MAG: nucleoid-associated protein, YbaB/EbfC family [Deltaproteobacteria bacterium RIFOXYA12_FULL_58_15]|nr:MAG: nucleoid-associated protein, YbaB/EbfC family [Deltaproteobacteria bacterium RIFOXYA12_FULL_58_15]